MKKIFLLFFTIILLAFSAKSQDTIVQMDEQQIAAKVLEITPEFVKYKKFNNLDGPLVSILKGQVYMIKYENGTHEVLNKKTITPDNNTQVEYTKVDKNDKPNVTTVIYSKV
jgi:hypothetical protein